MKEFIKISEAEGEQLDHLVALALGWKIVMWGDTPVYMQASGEGRFRSNVKDWKPSTNWAQGGPIIESEGIDPDPMINDGGKPEAWCCFIGNISNSGDTLLIAAMRCFVSSKFEGLDDLLLLP